MTTQRHLAHRGDLVVLVAPDATRAEVEYMHETAAAALPSGLRLLVVGGGVGVHIARAQLRPRRGAVPRWAR